MKVLGILIFIFNVNLWAQTVAPTVIDTSAIEEKVVGIYYFNALFGHIHETPLKSSPSLTTIQCGHPLKVIESSKVTVGPEWHYVNTADYKGFVLKQYLGAKRPDCFQGKYPKFFDGLNLDLSEIYYWGRLRDQMVEGRSKVQ